MSSGYIGGNQVVQLPPVRSEWSLPNLVEIEPTLGHAETGHIWYLSRAHSPAGDEIVLRLGQKL